MKPFLLKTFIHPDESRFLHRQTVFVVAVPSSLKLCFLVAMVRFTIFLGASANAQSPASGSPTDTVRIKQMIQEAVLKSKHAQFDEASQLFNLVYRDSKRAGYQLGIVYGQIGLASAEVAGGRYSQAMEWLRGAEEANSDLGSSELASLIENRKGNIYDYLGDYELAARHYLNELAIREQDPKLNNAYTYSNIGQLFQKAKNFPMARKYLHMAERAALKGRDSNTLASVYINLSNLAYTESKKKITQKALAYSDRAVSIARAKKLPDIEGTALSNLAALKMSADTPEYASALNDLRAASNVIAPGAMMQGYVLLNMGVCYAELSAPKMAERLMREAEALAIHFGSMELRANVYDAFAGFYKRIGSYQKAVRYYDLLKGIRDTLSDRELYARLSKLQFDYETAKKDNELMRRQQKIDQQRLVISRRNIQVISVLAIIVLAAVAFVIYSRSRRRLIRQELEIAAWQASLHGEERERTRLARQLHDQIGGSLSTARMWFATIHRSSKVEIKDTDFEQALALLDSTLAEVRNTAHHLLPELLLRHGLIEAVGIYCANIERATGLRVEYQYYGFIGELGANLELVIYRAVQELIQNVIRHAAATSLLVQLSRHDEILSLTVEDDGMGTSDSLSDGVGLRGIQETIKKLHGQFSFQQQKGKGTTVYIEINASIQAAT